MYLQELTAFLTVAIGLIILAYLGHLFWLGLSWLFRTIFIRRRCAECGQRLVGHESCAACDKARLQLSSRPSVSEDLRAAERLRQYAGFQGWLDDEQNQYLEGCLTRLRDRISGNTSPLGSTSSSAPEVAQPINQPAQAVPPLSSAPAIEPQVITAQVVATPAPVHALDQEYEPALEATLRDAQLSSTAAMTQGRAPIAAPVQAQVLRSFMERSNIRWVELVSASLVVVCSVGLVISLWSTLSRTSRFFPSLVFMLATLAVHAAGQYTLKRWKLRTTSRGILHIGLMLIPLSVLVGILLAHRQGDRSTFELNMGSCLAIGVGLVVYSGLAITAARSLFTKYFAPVAVCNIVGSAVLLPIDLTSIADTFNAWSLVALGPCVCVSMLVSLVLTRQAAWRLRWTNASARRHIGMAVQTLYVTLVACVFWYLKFKPTLIGDAISDTQTSPMFAAHAWWMIVALLGVAWSAWGWSISLSRGSLVLPINSQRIRLGADRSTVDRDASWFIVVCAALAILATTAWAAGLWQASHSRLALVTLLAIGGVWWIAHGALGRLALPQWLGSIALIVAAAIGCETLRTSWSEPLLTWQWISQARVSWLTTLGAAAVGMTMVCLMAMRARVDTSSQLHARPAERVDQFMIKYFMLAGGTVMLAAACLTVLAACVPLGATPNGGQWAAWYLAVYGLTLSAAGIGIERERVNTSAISAMRWIAPLLLPIGMAISILATIRFMQASESMPEWVIALRPRRAWSVGLVTLAMLWSLVAVVLKQLGWSTKLIDGPSSTSHWYSIGSIDWLNLLAIMVSMFSMLGVVRLSDHLGLVAQLYWQLPILCAAIWWSWRANHAREFMVLTASVWCMTLLFTLGFTRAWWHSLPLAVSVAHHVAVGSTVILAAALSCSRFSSSHLPGENSCSHLQGESRSANSSAANPSSNTGLFQPTYWAAAVFIMSSLVALLITLAIPSVVNLGTCLGLLQSGLENNASPVPLALMLPSIPQAAGVVGTIILWSFAAWFGSRLPQSSWLRMALGFTPVMLALTLAATVPTPYALSVCLAVLSLSLIASELTMLIFKSRSDLSEDSWQLTTSSTRDEHSIAKAFAIGQAIAVGCLLGLTGLAIFLGWNGRLSEHLLPAVELASAATTSDHQPRWWAMLSWMWPALAFLSMRWALAVARDIGSSVVASLGGVLAMLVACGASLVYMAAIVPWLYGSIAWLQWFVIAISTLVCISLGATLLRNFAGLRAVDRGQTSSWLLIGKAAGGRRWKRAVSAAISMSRGGTLGMLALCAIAAMSNVMVPIRTFESIHALAVWPTALAYVLLAMVVWVRVLGDGIPTEKKSFRMLTSEAQAAFLAPELRASWIRASLVRACLQMLAPIAAVFYAAWLEADPGRYDVGSRHFEPYRAQLILWLVALAVGLCLRFSCSLKNGWASGQAMWLALAGLVGTLGIVSTTTDPQPIWPAVELGVLALLAVLSGCASGQAWRGHVAAVIASVACITFTLPIFPDLDFAWILLIGPLLVAGVSLAWNLVVQHTVATTDPSGVFETQSRPTQMSRTVDQTVSQHVPMFVCLISCVWVLLGSWFSAELRWPFVAGVGVGAWLLAMGRIWDSRRGGRGVAIYTSFVAVALTVSVLIGYFNELPLATRGLMFMAFGLGSLAVVAGCMREWMRESSRWIPALRLGKLAVQAADFEQARRWMVPWHTMLGVLILIPCGLLALSLDERALRMANAALPLLSGLSILPIAIDAASVAFRSAKGAGAAIGSRERYSQPALSRTVGLWLISIPLVLFLWADLPEFTWNGTTVDTWYYAQRTMLALALLGWGHWALSHWLVGKLDWPEQLYSTSWFSFVGAAIVGTWMLIGETIQWWPGFARSAELSVQIAWLVTWIALVARALQFALRPMGLDAGSSLKLRQSAVYAAELGLALLAASTYVCFPNLFGGLLGDWWPLVVYGIAMLSAALGHWAATSKQEVIADPVRRSSLLLPLVPLLGVWMPFSQQLDTDWSDWQSYSLVLFAGSALYALHGWLKPSVKLHALAGTLVLLAFWSLLHSRPSLRFLAHPQFWVVPPAIATLIFVETNRRRLDPSVVTASRYLAILLAYLSSTAEIILKAFEGQMWQPLLLLLLAVAGMLVGVALRVRAFLFCGSTFVIVALVGMVWHAQQAIDQVWPWWAFGILTGVSLIVMLGYFEKNRPRVLAYVERLKSWQ